MDTERADSFPIPSRRLDGALHRTHLQPHRRNLLTALSSHSFQLLHHHCRLLVRLLPLRVLLVQLALATVQDVREWRGAV